MNSGMQNVVKKVFSSIVQTQFVPVRYRYYADKLAAGPIRKDYGYKDRVAWSGPLPRLKDAPPLPLPPYYRPDPWSREKVLKGRNDYIDLLGGGRLKPPDVSYEIPKWLRGRRGNEMQLLLLKQKIYANTRYQYEEPTRWNNISKRVSYLYKYLNSKTKTHFSRKQ